MEKAKDKVLIIESDREIASRYEELLTRGYTVTVVNSGSDAVKAIKSTPDLDIVLLDQNLADTPGLELLQKIKKEYPRLPVIFIIKQGEQDLAIKAFRCGADDYIEKPFSTREFFKRVEFTLSLARLGAVNRPE